MTTQIEKWDFFEHTMRYHDADNPFIDVNFRATFTNEDNTVEVVGFYDGDGAFKVRFMPNREGEWQFVTQSNVPALDQQWGAFECVAPSAENHGPVRVAEKLNFAYADGSPYIPVGTTCYVWNLQGEVLEGQTLSTLKNAPFNKMRMCVFPKRFPFNQNEPPSYPFPGESGNWEFSRFNPSYFQHLEQRILDLRVLGIEADLILFHPYDEGTWDFDKMPADVNARYLRYLVARLGAIRNVWWSFANEYEVLRHHTMEDWDHYMQLVQAIDPYDHLRSIHNLGVFYDHNKPWVTHCSIQHGETVRVNKWLERYQKPVIVDECGYEGDIDHAWGDLSAEEMVVRFWLGFTQGAFVGHGETYYNEEEILWWSKGGKLVGGSPRRIAFLRDLFESAPPLTPMQRIEPEEFVLSEVDKVFNSGKALNTLERMTMAGWFSEAAGVNIDAGYFLFYYGMHQPGGREYQLPTDETFRIDLIDTWNMTIETVAEQASGVTRISMPRKKYMAVCIQRDSL